MRVRVRLRERSSRLLVLALEAQSGERPSEAGQVARDIAQGGERSPRAEHVQRGLQAETAHPRLRQRLGPKWLLGAPTQQQRRLLARLPLLLRLRLRARLLLRPRCRLLGLGLGLG